MIAAKAFKSLILCFATLIFLLLYSQRAESHSLTVNVDNLRNSQGVLLFALYDKDGSIPDENFKKCIKILKGKIINNSSVAVFSDLQIGKYAVSILHDENNNGKIDMGFILPIEGIGFSNYQSIRLNNRPNFLKASFDFQGDLILMVKTIYF